MIELLTIKILPFITLLYSTILGLYVIRKSPSSLLNRIFFCICLSFSAWFSFYIPIALNLNDQIILMWFKISYCFISFIPITCFTFITTYLEHARNKKIFITNVSIGIILSILSLFSDYIVAGINTFETSKYPKAGTLHPLLVLHCITLAFFSLKILIKHIKESTPSIKKQHFKYMLLGIISLIFASLDFLKNYGLPIIELGPLAALGYLLFSSIGIIKYQLLNIEIVIQKGLIYTILVSSISTIFMTFTVISENIFHNIFRYNKISDTVIIALLISIIFTPLKELIQKIVDKLFFKKSINQLEIENQNLLEEVAKTQRLKSIAILASGLAHEIKNPLTPIKVFAEYLPKKLDDKEFLSKFATIINKEVSRINELVNELLDFAKPSAPELKPVRINDLINNIIELLNSNALKNNIQVYKEITTPFDTTILIDSKQIKQALLNILLNAIEVMPNGGTLRINTHHNSDNFTITIADSGPGIDKKDLPHIFDPFFTKKDNGTGLGLSITHEIIKNHNGRIIVESSAGNGATFIIKLPN